MCLFPKLIRNKKYCSTKKNGGVIPAVNDKRVLYVAVGCGKCMECLKKKATYNTLLSLTAGITPPFFFVLQYFLFLINLGNKHIFFNFK